MSTPLPRWRSLHLGGLEVVRDAAVDHLQVAAAAGAGAAALDGLHGPVVAAAAGARVGAGGAALPLDVVGVAATATAQNVRAPVALTHRRRTLRHFLSGSTRGESPFETVAREKRKEKELRTR